MTPKPLCHSLRPFWRLLLASSPLVTVMDEVRQCVKQHMCSCCKTYSRLRSDHSPMHSGSKAYGMPFVLTLNGPKSLHNLNESRTFLEENQGGQGGPKGRRELWDKISSSSTSISLRIQKTHFVKLYNFSAASLYNSPRNRNTHRKEATEKHSKRWTENKWLPHITPQVPPDISQTPSPQPYKEAAWTTMTRISLGCW